MRANASRIDVSLERRAGARRRCARRASRRTADRPPTRPRSGDGLEHVARDRVGQPLLRALDPRRHALAGNRAAHEHHLPEVPRDHPSAGRRLLDRELDLLTFVEHQWASSVERDRRQAQGVAHQALERGLHRPARARPATFVAAKGAISAAASRSYAARAVGRQLDDRRRDRASRSSLREPANQRRPLVSSHLLRAGTSPVQFAGAVLEQPVERCREGATAALRSQPGDDAIEVGGQRLAIVVRRPSVSAAVARHAHRAPPVVEQLEDVGFAELDAHRPPPRALGVVALAVAIDAAERDRQRHALRRPAATPARTPDRRSGSDGLRSSGRDRSRASRQYSEASISAAVWWRSQISRRPSSVRLASTCWIDAALAGDDVGEAAGRDDDRRGAAVELVAHAAHQAVDHLDVAEEQPDCIASTVFWPMTLAGLRTSTRGRRAARWNSASAEMPMPGQITPPRYSPRSR